MLNSTLLSNALSELDFTPEIDLFASRLNAQFPRPRSEGSGRLHDWLVCTKILRFPAFQYNCGSTEENKGG